jgi:hypothetical protein
VTGSKPQLLPSLQEQGATGQASPGQQQQQLELLLALGRRDEATALLQQLANRAPERWGCACCWPSCGRDLWRSQRRHPLSCGGCSPRSPTRSKRCNCLALLLQEQGQG